MKYIGLIVLMLTAVCVFNGVAASSATADWWCSRVSPEEGATKGKYTNPLCQGAPLPGLYTKIKGDITHHFPGTHIYCVATEDPLDGAWESSLCEGTRVVEGPYIRVIGVGGYWARRGSSKEGGTTVGPEEPEQIKGTGGSQELKGKIASLPIVLKTSGVKLNGTIYSNAFQGQMKIELKYPPITVVEPSLKGCQAEVFSQAGAHNVVFAEGHLGWTWNGEEKQLEETQQKAQKPDVIFTPPGTYIQEGATELPKGTFAEIKFTGSGCGALIGTFPIKGSTIGSLKPTNLNEWTKALTLTTPEGKVKQHFWNGEKSVGVETGLLFGGNPASLTGETTITTNEEMSILEE